MIKNLKIIFLLFLIPVSAQALEIDREIVLSDGLNAQLDYYSRARYGLVSLKLDINNNNDFRDEQEILDDMGFSVCELPPASSIVKHRVPYASDTEHGFSFAISDQLGRSFIFRQIFYFPKFPKNLIFVRQVLCAVQPTKVLDVKSRIVFRKQFTNSVSRFSWMAVSSDKTMVVRIYLQGPAVKKSACEREKQNLAMIIDYQIPEKGDIPEAWQVQEDFCIYAVRDPSFKNVEALLPSGDFAKMKLQANTELDRMLKDLIAKENAAEGALAVIDFSVLNTAEIAAVSALTAWGQAKNRTADLRISAAISGKPVEDPNVIQPAEQKINDCYQQLTGEYCNGVSQRLSLGAASIAGGCPCTWNSRKAQFANTCVAGSTNAGEARNKLASLISEADARIASRAVPSENVSPTSLKEPLKTGKITDDILFGDNLDSVLTNGPDSIELELAKRESAGLKHLQIAPVFVKQIQAFLKENNFDLIDRQMDMITKTGIRVVLPVFGPDRALSKSESGALTALLKHIREKYSAALAAVSYSGVSRKDITALTSFWPELAVFPYQVFEWPAFTSYNMTSIPEIYGPDSEKWYAKYETGHELASNDAIYLSAVNRLWDSFLNGNRVFFIDFWANHDSCEETEKYRNFVDWKNGLLRKSVSLALPVFGEMNALGDLILQTQPFAKTAVFSAKGEAAENLLVNAHIPFQTVDEADIRKGLGKFQSLWLKPAGIMSPQTATQIRKWVKAGGNVVISGYDNGALSESAGGVIFTRKIENPGEVKFGTDAGVSLSGQGSYTEKGLKIMEKSCGYCFRLKKTGKDAEVIANYSDGTPAITMRHFGKGRVVVCGFPVDGYFEFTAFDSPLNPETFNVSEPETCREELIGQFARLSDFILDRAGFERVLNVKFPGIYSTQANIKISVRQSASNPAVLYIFAMNTGHAVKSPRLTEMYEGNNIQATLIINRKVTRIFELLRKVEVPFTSGDTATIALLLEPGKIVAFEVR